MRTAGSTLYKLGTTHLAAALLMAFSLACGAPDSGDGSDGVDEVESALSVCADGPTVEGVDVSRFQGDIDWKKIASAGKKFAYIQVARGTSRDQYFAYNWAQAKANGVLRGAYIRFFPEQDLVAQANLIINAGPYPAGDLPPMLDIEDRANFSVSALAARVEELIRRVKDATGRTPVIYTGYYFWKDYVRATGASNTPLFVANYSSNCPLVPAPWKRWAIHQYTDKGRLAAVTVNTVDLNRFNGTMEDLQAFVNEGPGSVIGGTGVLTGSIYAGMNTDARIAGARVSVNGQESVTGPDGSYRFQLPPGTYTVTARAEGYRGTTVTKTVEMGATIWGSIGLTPGNDTDAPILVPNVPGLSGFITRADTGARIPDAVLTLRDASGETIANTVSSPTGAFFLESSRAIDGTVSAQAEGFAPISLRISLAANEHSVVDVRMDRLETDYEGSDGSFQKPEKVVGCSAGASTGLGALLLLAGLATRRRHSC